MTRDIKSLAKIFLGFLLFTGSAHGAAFQFGGLRLDSVTVTSSASSTQLTTSDAQLRVVNGATTDIQKLPDATTLRAGYFYGFYNGGTGPLTISDSSSTPIAFVEPNVFAQFFVSSSSTSGGPWYTSKSMSDNAACSVPISGGAGVLLIDWRLGPCFAITLSSNVGIVFTNRPTTLPHKTIFIRITNTASNFTASFQSANVLFSSGTIPAQTAGAKIDAYTCDHDPVSNKTICNAVQNF